MELELATHRTPALVTKALDHTATLAAGQSLKVEVGEAELIAVVPPGKKWVVKVKIHVTETDA